MKMRAVSGVDLPPGKTVDLKPGGYHVMLMGLKKPISAGDHVMLTLVFEGRNKKRSNIEVHAMARPINTMGNPAPKGEAMKMAQ